MKRIGVALVLVLGVALTLLPGAAWAHHATFHGGFSSGPTSFGFAQGPQHFGHHGGFIPPRGFVRGHFPVAVASPVIVWVYPAPRVFWVPDRWAWTGFEWVWVPGHWAW